MRIAVLTTETLHHAYFVKSLAAEGHELRVFTETRHPPIPYEVAHPFEATRELYEREHWFGGRACRLGELAQTLEFGDLNEASAINALRRASADIAVVFGTGRLGTTAIGLFPGAIVNLHGGDPEMYRGLDTHLWAIWHRDFGQLITTLHRLNAELDDGDIVGRQVLPVAPRLQLHQLRAVNTEICVELTKAALRSFATAGTLVARTQRQKGRYYSVMPTALKDVCVRRFARYTEAL